MTDYNADYWKGQIEASKKERESWLTQHEYIVARYRDEKDNRAYESQTRFNAYWSNTQTLLPMLYSATPKPEIIRRFKDRDKVGAMASNVLERVISNIVDMQDFDDVAKSAVEDYSHSGMGQLWCRYDPIIEESKVQVEQLDGEFKTETQEELVFETVAIDFVSVDDFIWTPYARTWQDVDFVGRRVYMIRDDVEERFGKEVAEKITYDDIVRSDDSGLDSVSEKASVYEIWCKRSGMVYWVSPGYDGILDEAEPMFNVEGFFPCPRPMLGTTTNNSIIPVPDYVEAQGPYKELDGLTERITNIADAIKAVGFYDSSFDKGNSSAISNALRAYDNTLLPIEDMSAALQSGGKLIDWIPVDMLQTVLASLINMRAQIKQDLDEISGISDVVRGQSQANETATAQRIKSQFATMRLGMKQKEVQRFMRDLFNIIAEIVSEQFDVSTLAMMSGVEQMKPEEQQMFAPAVELLRQDTVRDFRIDIETDSTIEPDETIERQKRVEFIEAASVFIERMLPVAQAVPALAPFIAELMLFGIRGFKTGRPLEDAFERALQEMQMMPPEQKPNAEAEKLSLEKEKAQADIALKQQELQSKVAFDKIQTEHNIQQDRAKMQMDMVERALRNGQETSI